MKWSKFQATNGVRRTETDALRLCRTARACLQGRCGRVAVRHRVCLNAHHRISPGLSNWPGRWVDPRHNACWM